MSFLIALLLGVVSAFSFQPVGLWPLMLLAFAGLCELIARAGSLKRALAIGWCFGLGQFALGLNWIATAFTFQAAMPAWLGWIAVVLLSLYLAVYPMIAVGLARRFSTDNRLALVLALAGGWAITEWLRAKIFTGFAWNPVGVTLVDTPWRETSIFIGTYGLAALVVLGGGALWLAVRRAWRPAGAIAISIALLLLLPTSLVPDRSMLKAFDVTDSRENGQRVGNSAVRFTPIAPPKPAPNPQPPPPIPPPPVKEPAPLPPPAPPSPRDAFATGTVRLVQPNIGQADKWRDGFDRIAAARLATLSRRPFDRQAPPAEAIYWPEAAVTNPLLDERRAAQGMVKAERSRAVANLTPGQLLATGGLGLLARDGLTVDGATNSVFVMNAAGELVARYDKAHLVPYGEYLPMRPVLSAIGLSRLAPGDLDFRPGPGPRTLRLPNGRRMGVQICYEIIFSGEVVDRRDRPDHLFNPSNDAWFGAWGPPQHLAQARLRAAEEGLPVLRATPTGISALIDARGQLVAQVGAAQAGLIDAEMPMAAAPTLFSRFGNIIPLALGFLLLISAIALGRRRR